MGFPDTKPLMNFLILLGVVVFSVILTLSFNSEMLGITARATDSQDSTQGEPSNVEAQDEPSNSATSSQTATKRSIVRGSTSVDYENSDYSVEFIGDSGQLSGINTIVVSEPYPLNQKVANQLINWKSTIDVSKDLSDSKLEVNLPAGAKYVRVVGPEASGISVGTQEFYGDFSDVFGTRQAATKGVVSITNIAEGPYEVLFSTGAPFVLSVETTSPGEATVYVKNPTNLDQYGVSIVAKVQGVKKSSAFEVSSSDGRTYSSESYDTDGDGIIEVVKFVDTLPKLSEKAFFVDEKEIEEGEIIKEELEEDFELSSELPISLSPECEQDIQLDIADACEMHPRTDSILKGALEVGVRTASYSFANSDCPTSFDLTETCSLAKEVNLVEENVLESPSENGLKVNVVSKRFKIMDVETGRAVAVLQFDTEDGVNIIFEQ